MEINKKLELETTLKIDKYLKEKKESTEIYMSNFDKFENWVRSFYNKENEENNIKTIYVTTLNMWHKKKQYKLLNYFGEEKTSELIELKYEISILKLFFSMMKGYVYIFKVN